MNRSEQNMPLMIKTWRERIGADASFPLHVPTDVERAMVGEIDDLRLQLAHHRGAAEKMTDDLEWHKEALKRHVAKLRSVWEGLRQAVEKYAGQPCEGEPFDRLHELLARQQEAATPRTNDFARVVRTTGGQQVLFFKQVDFDSGNVLHCVANFDGYQAAISIGGMADADFATALDRVDMAMADKVLAQVAELGLDEVSHG
jgi:hypothetical protein